MLKIKRAFLYIAIIFAFSALQIFGQGQVIYDSIPSPLPGNLASLGFEATSSSEFGDRLQFAPATGRNLLKATVTMSSWGCENGAWFSNDCVTTPGATFSHPITLNVYNVGPGNSVGSLIGSVTQTFTIPYRPSADFTNCTGGRWFDSSSSTCFNGFATNIVFNLSGLVVPDEVIYGVAYNTTHHGSAPIGAAASCFTESGGCGYDSLNVALQGVASVGVNPDPDDAYWNTTYAPFYCDGGVGGVGIFRRDGGAGCWTDFQPSIKFIAANPPANKDQCKNNGWLTRTRADGTAFKNQGDCIQYVNTGR